MLDLPQVNYPLLVDSVSMLGYNPGMERPTSIAVFSGSSFGSSPAYREGAAALGRKMAEEGITLVYGGGYCGLMGAVAEAVRDGGGKVIGVLPEAMDTQSVRSKDIETELLIVPDMHERKRTMYSLSEGFIALPGGIGTMEELMEIFTWKQLGIHKWNIGLLNTSGYWDPMIAMLDRSVSEGFLSKAVRDALIVEEDPGRLLARIIDDNGPELPRKLG